MCTKNMSATKNKYKFTSNAFLENVTFLFTYYQVKIKELCLKINKEDNGGQKNSNPHIIHNLSSKIYVHKLET